MVDCLYRFFIGYVLQLWAHLQCHFNAIITLAHIPGVRNATADAISRAFDVPNGAAIRASLPGNPVTDLANWWSDIEHLTNDQRDTPADIARHARMYFST